MKFQDFDSRMAGKKAGRIASVGANDHERKTLSEWQSRGWDVIHYEGEPGAAVQQAVDAALRGDVQFMFCSSDDNLRLIKHIDRCVPKEYQPVSRMQAFELPSYPKLLWVGFTPTARYDSIPEAIRGVQIMTRALADLGEPEARVALLSCVETISPGVHSTIWEATLGHMSHRGQFGKAKVDGPLAFDLAVSPRAVDEKNLRSDIGGEADLVIPPDLNSFITLVDAIHLTGEHNALGVIVGGPCPIAMPPHRSPRHTDLSLIAAALLAG